jgi:hypothetical protein
MPKLGQTRQLAAIGGLTGQQRIKQRHAHRPGADSRHWLKCRFCNRDPVLRQRRTFEGKPVPSAINLVTAQSEPLQDRSGNRPPLGDSLASSASSSAMHTDLVLTHAIG